MVLILTKHFLLVRFWIFLPITKFILVPKKISRFTIGLKAKLLFGVSNFRTDEPTINYRTKSDFYQWEFDVDYSIRSSSALILNDITDITLNPSGFNFDHLFYNNTGLAFDIGMNMELSKKLIFSGQH